MSGLTANARYLGNVRLVFLLCARGGHTERRRATRANQSVKKGGGRKRALKARYDVTIHGRAMRVTMGRCTYHVGQARATSAHDQRLGVPPDATCKRPLASMAAASTITHQIHFPVILPWAQIQARPGGDALALSLSAHEPRLRVPPRAIGEVLAPQHWGHASNVSPHKTLHCPVMLP